MRIFFSICFSILLLSCGDANSESEMNTQEDEVETDSVEVDNNFENELVQNNGDSDGTPFEELVLKFQDSQNNLNNEDLLQLRADVDYLEGSNPFTIGHFELAAGQVLAYGFGFIADAIHVTGTIQFAYYDHDGIYINTANAGAIDDYDIYTIQDNIIAVTSEYMEFVEGEYVMEETGKTIYTIDYYVESEGKFKSLQDVEEKELKILRNRIFAKHGYIFKNEFYTNYFTDFAWYTPQHDNVDHLLTTEEKALADHIKILENK